MLDCWKYPCTLSVTGTWQAFDTFPATLSDLAWPCCSVSYFNTVCKHVSENFIIRLSSPPCHLFGRCWIFVWASSRLKCENICAIFTFGTCIGTFLNVATFSNRRMAGTRFASMFFVNFWYSCLGNEASSTGFVTFSYLPFIPFTVNWTWMRVTFFNLRWLSCASSTVCFFDQLRSCICPGSSSTRIRAFSNYPLIPFAMNWWRWSTWSSFGNVSGRIRKRIVKIAFGV